MCLRARPEHATKSGRRSCAPNTKCRIACKFFETVGDKHYRIVDLVGDFVSVCAAAQCDPRSVSWKKKGVLTTKRRDPTHRKKFLNSGSCQKKNAVGKFPVFRVGMPFFSNLRIWDCIARPHTLVQNPPPSRLFCSVYRRQLRKTCASE
jgi:hypothetical protein